MSLSAGMPKIMCHVCSSTRDEMKDVTFSVPANSPVLVVHAYSRS